MSTITEPNTTTSSDDAEAEAAWVAIATEAIARRAYEIYLEQGAPDGQALEHWLQAERELEHGIRAEADAAVYG